MIEERKERWKEGKDEGREGRGYGSALERQNWTVHSRYTSTLRMALPAGLALLCLPEIMLSSPVLHSSSQDFQTSVLSASPPNATLNYTYSISEGKYHKEKDYQKKIW